MRFSLTYPKKKKKVFYVGKRRKKVFYVGNQIVCLVDAGSYSPYMSFFMLFF
jgi:hypothetical protein